MPTGLVAVVFPRLNADDRRSAIVVSKFGFCSSSKMTSPATCATPDHASRHVFHATYLPQAKINFVGICGIPQ